MEPAGRIRRPMRYHPEPAEMRRVAHVASGAAIFEPVRAPRSRYVPEVATVMHRLVVEPHRPWLKYVVIVLLGGLAALAFHVVQQRDRIATLDAKADYQAAARTRAESALAGARALTESLREKVAMLERRYQVDAEAYRETDLEMRRMQDRILALREEVMFYRRIMSEDRGRGLRIQTFDIRSVGAGERYHFELVLTRTIDNDRVAEGMVALAISGERGGRPAELSHASVVESGEGPLEFSFKYFQRIEGLLSLPPGFIPRRAFVKVDVKGEKPPRIEQSFEWPEETG